MSDIKDAIKNAAHQVADTAKGVGHKLVEGATHAADWVKDKAGLAHAAGPGTADVKPLMPVVASCGTRLGSVESLESGAIKVSHKDSPDGLPHFVPADWVRKVDEHVHLSKNATETKREWKPTAAACATSNA